MPNAYRQVKKTQEIILCLDATNLGLVMLQRSLADFLPVALLWRRHSAGSRHVPTCLSGDLTAFSRLRLGIALPAYLPTSARRYCDYLSLTLPDLPVCGEISTCL